MRTRIKVNSENQKSLNERFDMNLQPGMTLVVDRRLDESGFSRLVKLRIETKQGRLNQMARRILGQHPMARAATFRLSRKADSTICVVETNRFLRTGYARLNRYDEPVNYAGECLAFLRAIGEENWSKDCYDFYNLIMSHE